MDKVIRLSICVPAFNEENSLALSVQDLINVLTSHLKEIEIIIIDDGSSDATFDIAVKLSGIYDGIKVVKHDRNLGIGESFRDGLKVAKFEYFSWFPADCENSAAELLKCLPYLNKSTIVTSHHLGHDPRSFLRRTISKFYTLFYNIFFGLNVKYYNGLTIFPAELVRSLNLCSVGFAVFAESIVKSLKSGARIKELLIPLRSRSCGKSKSLTPVSFFRMAKDMRWVFSYKHISKYCFLN